jgi:excisionase family DNA binding protein
MEQGFHMHREPDRPTPLLVDRREAGRMLGVSAGTIDNLRARGELPSVKIGTRRLYQVTDLLRYIEVRKGVQG